MIDLLNSDARRIPLSDQSVQCIITSPPYWGLRDYGTATWQGGDPVCNHKERNARNDGNRNGVDGFAGSMNIDGHADMGVKQYRDTCPKCGAIRIDAQIGLERVPDCLGWATGKPCGECYVCHIVAVMRECRRVLRNDGVVFLNLGDSYMSSGTRQTGRNDTNRETPGGRGGSFRGGERRVIAYGTFDKAPEDYQDRDCLCGNLCDVCRVVYQNHKSHNDNLLVSMLTASLSETNHEHMESQIAHLPTSDSLNLEGRISDAILDSEHLQGHEYERLRAVLVSMLGESYPQFLDVCLQRANRGECLLCARSLVDCVQGCVDKTLVCTCDTAKMSHSLVRRMLDKEFSYVAYPHYTTESLKPKDICMIPARVALALQADGWYLRSEIVWSKPNPMPESVTDRPTKAHEMIYLLTKEPRYYYDIEAIREPLKIGADHDRPVNGHYGANSSKAIGQGDTHIMTSNLSGRNRRSVWTVATQPYSGAHYAVFPIALVEPMILAGTSARGACPKCGKAWMRVVDKQQTGDMRWAPTGGLHRANVPSQEVSESSVFRTGSWNKSTTLGWRPACSCYDVPPLPDEPEMPEDARPPWKCSICNGSGIDPSRFLDVMDMPPQTNDEHIEFWHSTESKQYQCKACDGVGVKPANKKYMTWLKRCKPIRAERARLLDLYATLPVVPCIVLDPFAGSGTVGKVSVKHGRRFVGCELNREYIDLAFERTSKVQTVMQL